MIKVGDLVKKVKCLSGKLPNGYSAIVTHIHPAGVLNMRVVVPGAFSNRPDDYYQFGDKAWGTESKYKLISPAQNDSPQDPPSLPSDTKSEGGS